MQAEPLMGAGGEAGQGAIPRPQQGEPRVHILILNWNGWADTVECLASLLRQGYANYQIVVCDNGSTDGSLERIRVWAKEQAAGPGHSSEDGAGGGAPMTFVEYDRQQAEAGGRPEDAHHRLVLVDVGENLGFASGNNVALAYVQGQEDAEWVLLLNNDTVVESDALTLLVQQGRRENAGAVMPLLRHYEGREVWYAGGRIVRPIGRLQHSTTPRSELPYRTEIFTACCILIRVDVVARVGGFDPRYFLYLEDTDLALRIREANFDLWVEPRSVVYHKVSRSSGGQDSPNVYYYCIRNNLLLVSERSSGRLERWLGYGYLAALSLKIVLNLFVRGIPRKRAVTGSLVQAWSDFRGRRWGARR